MLDKWKLHFVAVTKNIELDNTMIKTFTEYLYVGISYNKQRTDGDAK